MQRIVPPLMKVCEGVFVILERYCLEDRRTSKNEQHKTVTLLRPCGAHLVSQNLWIRSIPLFKLWGDWAPVQACGINNIVRYIYIYILVRLLIADIKAELHPSTWAWILLHQSASGTPKHRLSFTPWQAVHSSGEHLQVLATQLSTTSSPGYG